MAIMEQTPTTIVDPATAGIKARYENFIGGEGPADRRGVPRGLTPATGEPFTQVPYSGAADIELALDAAHAAQGRVGRDLHHRAREVLNGIADAIEDNLETLAVAESYDNGKPLRESLAADVPLAADHFRYFAS